uniref:Uncharacterized protein n=1 Tax=Brassica oleracea var. oleracea TaxID=109376 RepID=A0A0D3B016_BRAOL
MERSLADLPERHGEMERSLAFLVRHPSQSDLPERHGEVARVSRETPLSERLTRATWRGRSRFHGETTQNEARSDLSERPTEVAPEGQSDLSERHAEVAPRLFTCRTYVF